MFKNQICPQLQINVNQAKCSHKPNKTFKYFCGTFPNSNHYGGTKSTIETLRTWSI